MTVSELVPVIRSPFIIIKDGNGDNELYNSTDWSRFDTFPSYVGSLEIKEIRSVRMPRYDTIIIDV